MVWSSLSSSSSVARARGSVPGSVTDITNKVRSIPSIFYSKAPSTFPDENPFSRHKSFSS